MAEQHALQQGYKKLSLIVMEENTGAYNLYLKNGFHEVMRENIVPHPLIYCRRDALLMVRDLSVS
jgi:ribosomal protein S18 acetylase RimI-like enzyme